MIEYVEGIEVTKVCGEWYASLRDICKKYGLSYIQTLEKIDVCLHFYEGSHPTDVFVDQKQLSKILSKEQLKPIQNHFHDKKESEDSYYARQIKGQRIEVWDVTQAWDLGRNEAQSAQYIFRAKYKGQEKDDLKKAIKFLERALEEMDSSALEEK